MSHAAKTASEDRLVTTLFCACLAHGVLILGVSFSGLLPGDFKVPPSIEVVLVQSQSQNDLAPDEAHYFSAENQSGSGTTTDRVPASSELVKEQLQDNFGDLDGTALEDQLTQRSPQSASIVASSAAAERRLATLEDPSELEASRDERARLLRAEAATSDLLADEDGETQIYSDQIKELFVSVNTRESKVARYLAQWKRKVEQVGTLNFPSDELLQGLSGNPTLEVAIRADGTLHDVQIRRSSSHPRLDQSAMQIVRLASPFEPFPGELRGEYDVLRFVYIWQFDGGRRVRSTIHTPDG